MSIENAFQAVYFRDKPKLAGNRVVQISSFFGLPNDFDESQISSDFLFDTDSDKRQQAITWGNIAKNFIGWPSQKISTLGILIRILPMLAITIAHLWQALSKTFLNTLKLVTEFLPTMIASTVHDTEWHQGIKWPIFLICVIWKWTGESITSPFSGVYRRHIGHVNTGNKLWAVLGGVLSISVSLIFYSILFPLAIQAIAVNLPVVFMKIGSFVSANLPWLANVAQAVVYSPVLQNISHAFLAAFNIWTLGAAPAFAQVTAFLGIGVLFAGQGIQMAYNFISETCWKQRPPRSFGFGDSVASQADHRAPDSPTTSQVSRRLSYSDAAQPQSSLRSHVSPFVPRQGSPRNNVEGLPAFSMFSGQNSNKVDPVDEQPDLATTATPTSSI